MARLWTNFSDSFPICIKQYSAHSGEFHTVNVTAMWHRSPDNPVSANPQGDPNVPGGQVTFEVDLNRPTTEDMPTPEGEPRQFELPQVYEARYTNFPRVYLARYASDLNWIFSVLPCFAVQCLWPCLSSRPSFL